MQNFFPDFFNYLQQMSPFFPLFFFTTLLFSYPPPINSQPYDYPTANLSTSWTNSVDANHSVTFVNNSTVRAILLRGTFGLKFACGFYCNGDCQTYLFAIFIVQTNSGGGITMPSSGFPQVVWSANRNNPVRINSTLQFTAEGDLVLTDSDGTLAWSTNTKGLSVTSLNLTELGNLVLLDNKSTIVWQSFDYPTDVLVPGQILKLGSNLTASVSETNWTQGGFFTLSMTREGLMASVKSDPPQVYFDISYSTREGNREASYAKFRNGSLDLYMVSSEPSVPDMSLPLPVASSAQYLKFGSNGNLSVFEWRPQWREVFDILTNYLGECNLPMVCGEYGICSNGQCSCPGSSSSSANFRPVNDRKPELGCSEVTPLTCDASHSFLDFEDVNYMSFVTDIGGTDMATCKEACLRNCSCRAAIFRYGFNSSGGNCYLPNRIFSMLSNEKDKTHYNSSVSIKVQIDQITNSPPLIEVSSEGKKSILGPILGSTLGVFGAAVVIGLAIFVIRKKRKGEENEENYLDNVPGMPARFSYQELVIATENFGKKLGEGGFGSVFEGSLKDGTKIAVKCLDGVGQIKKSFLAEVESIGSIHHVNLARLIGFCAEKSHRLLVYEYMCNGSLERWIYNRNQENSLDWNCRRKIILDVAKGLAYLHEDCRQKIIHLDIKPQNILLDENFDAKLSDFGLAKLIDRNQSQVVTTMRGTPGYLAPEWLSAVITEKVDVYSFGIVILEILCGRKNFEQSMPEEDRHLLSVFKKKAEEERWLDISDKLCDGMESNGVEVTKIMQVAAWCLQSDYVKRPSMSVVIKVLEGVKDVQEGLDYDFLNPGYLIRKIPEIGSADFTPLLPSVLSGPR